VHGLKLTTQRGILLNGVGEPVDDGGSLGLDAFQT
jgi:hypothetical protein